MSLENEIKEAFKNHDKDARADGQSWNAVEKKVRRAHKQRVALVSTLTVALIAAAAVLVPRLTSDKVATRGFIGQTPSTTAAPANTPSPGFSPRPRSSAFFMGDLHATYRDDVQGWIIAYAEDWKESRFEGVTEFSPPGAPSPERGGPTFWVAVSILDGRPPSKRSAPATAATGFDERDGGSVITGLPGGGERQVYQYDWTGLCISTIECPQGPTTLQVVVEGSTAALWDRYHPISDTMLQTLRIAKDSGSTGDVHTRYGIVSSSAAIGYDELTTTLVRFLDARVEQANAEAFMSSQAKTDFANASNCLELYETRATHKQWTSYEVIGRFDDAARATFTLNMHTDPNNGGYVESLVVGRSGPTAGDQILAGNPSCNGN
jgi:hypothetical protein